MQSSTFCSNCMLTPLGITSSRALSGGEVYCAPIFSGAARLSVLLQIKTFNRFNNFLRVLVRHIPS